MTKGIVLRLALAGFIVVLKPTLHSQDGARLHALAASDTSPTFSLTLSPGTRNKTVSEYRFGNNMWMTILTNHDIDCSMDGDSGSNRMFDYEAIDEDGKPVEKRHHGTEGYQ
jgi:hypothetical protein